MFGEKGREKAKLTPIQHFGLGRRLRDLILVGLGKGAVEPLKPD